MRWYQLEIIAALIAATSFMLCGFLIVWLGHPHTQVAVWLPFLILCGDRLLTAESRAALIKSSALVALIIGVQFTGGHAQTSVDMLFGVTIYYVLRWLQLIQPTAGSLSDKTARLLIMPGIALTLGVLIAAPQLAPFLEWLPLSEILGSRSAGDFQPGSTELWRLIMPMGLLLFPNLFGNPTWSTTYWSPVIGQNFNEEALYLGTIPLLFALCALIARWRREPLVPIWAFVGLLSLGRALRLPVFDLINQLPGFNVAVSGRLRLIATFSLCVLAGIGAHAVLKRPQSGDRDMRKLCSRLLLGFIVLGTMLRISAIPGVIWASPPPQLTDIRLYLPVGVALAAWILLLAAGSLPRYAMPMGLLTLVIFELVLVGRFYNPAITREDFYPTTPIAERIRQDSSLFRISAPHADLVPEAYTMLGLTDIRGLDFRTLWYTWYLRAVQGRAGSIMITGFTRLDSPLIRLLNVKYIVAARTDDFIHDPTLHQVMRDGNLTLWEVNTPTPRAFMVYDLVLVDQEQQAIELLQREPAEARTRVILQRRDAPPMLPQAGEGFNEVANLRYDATDTEWRVQTAMPGYLFVSDAFYPGWHAEIDGAEVPIYRANLAFRAIYVPAGTHTIMFHFQPRLVLAALTISAAAIVLSFILLIQPWRWVRSSSITASSSE